MPFVYIVRCNFAAPEKEAAWNAWYSGPKIAQMLALPYFLSCQRFQRVAGTGRDYLALWTMQSPDAHNTPEYKAQWGFSEWTPLIADWSRDMFDAGGRPVDSLSVAVHGALYVVSFDGMSAGDAEAARAALPSLAEMMWLPIVGLDRHTPMIGLAPLSDVATAHASAERSTSRVQQAIYRPICDFSRAAL